MAGEQALQYVPVVRIFRRACGYEAFFAAYPLSATGGRRLKNAQVVTCPMLVHEQIALTLFSLTTYEQMPRATAIAEALRVNHTVKKVNLGKNNIGDAGKEALREAVKGRDGFELSMPA